MRTQKTTAGSFFPYVLGAFLLVLFVCIMLGVSLILPALGNGSKTSDLQPIPDLVGTSYTPASFVNFSVRLHYTYRPELPVHTVLAQSPAAGSLREAGATLDLTLSTAEAEKAVPDVVGLSPARATVILEACGITFSVEGAGNVVLRTTPMAGETVFAEETITLTLASATADLPDVVGRSLVEAKELLAAAGYTDIEITEQPHSAAAGTVLAVLPTDGRILLVVAATKEQEAR